MTRTCPARSIAIFHIAYADDWQQAEEHGAYRISTKGRSLEDEGFVHASYNHGQIAKVGEYLYAGESRELVVLVIDSDRVGAPVVAENLEGGEELYAHVYGVGPVTKTVPVRTTGASFEALWDRAVPRRSNLASALVAATGDSRRARRRQIYSPVIIERGRGISTV